MVFQVFKLTFSWDVPKMHYFSNNSSKIASKIALNLQFW